MIMAAVLALIVVASVLFHAVNPWWFTPLASNWKSMDDTITITLVITGAFFVGVNLFLAYTVVRYRHREDLRAAHEPHGRREGENPGRGRRYLSERENKRLERWLIGISTVGIMALLAPGLVVYASYVKAPPDALTVEVLGQQWQWRFRMPGGDNKLGLTETRFVTPTNPFGLDPADPAGQDDILVSDQEIHVPLGRPVHMIVRSHDVLHDFFAPNFRARMNMVPGQISTFWFTPTVAGRFEAMCSQLCGVGHPNMRAHVVVEDAAAYQAWLKDLQTFAMTQRPPSTEGGPAAQGRALADAKGCVACHSIDGSPRVGPSWKGLYGKNETLRDGGTALVDDAYLRAFIRDPQAARGVKGFAPVMPKIPLSDDELTALVAYIRALGTAPPAGASGQKAQR